MRVAQKDTGRSEPDFGQAALSHLDGLYSYAMSLARNEADAEDLVQETYLRAARAFGQLGVDSNLKSWLYTILRNIWRNQWRHINKGPRFVEAHDEQEELVSTEARSPDDPHASYVARAERDDVRAAVNKLPGMYREVIVLREFLGFSYREISGILQCPAGTVMSRLGRAREQLRVLLSQWKVDPIQHPIEGHK